MASDPVRNVIQHIPLWVLFLAGAATGAIIAVLPLYLGSGFFGGPPIVETILGLAMTILCAMCAGIDLMETRIKRKLQELKDIYETKTKNKVSGPG